MKTRTFEVASGITAIDTLMAGRERYTAAYLVTAQELTLIETGPATSVEAVSTALGSLGVGPDELAHIVVTHIHLDHAGGVGQLADRFPRAAVWVHERGAPHLADPTKLVASATRIYGQERLRELFGPVEPVDPERLRPLADGQTLAIGGRSVESIHTPGHASHHVCLVDSETGAVFTGDALGIHLPDLPVLRPATPPPDFDLELAVTSIERIRDRARSALLLAHFGPVWEIDRICDLAERRIRGWGDIVRRALRRTEDLDEVSEILARETASELRTGSDVPIDLERFETLSSVRMNAMGLIRYWKKRDEAHAAGAVAARAHPR
jgi:glyoxylase-like metal-dependent hydrolase (beta-lactamase superfamily II)